MDSDDYIIHTRDIEGVESEAVTDWFGTPMRGLYFVKSTLPGNVLSDDKTTCPIVLLPGGFDPKCGEYSDSLVRDLLERVGVPAVYEAHFCHEKRAGYLHTASVVEDVVHMCTDASARPVLVGLCAATLPVFGGLVETADGSAKPTALGALTIGSWVPSQYNLLGYFIARSTLKMAKRQSGKVRRYAGHGYLLDNGVNLRAWYAESGLHEKLVEARSNKADADRFPFPVEMIYFRIDMINGRSRRRLRRLFDSPKSGPKASGIHRSLRKASDADAMIGSFYERMVARAEGEPA
jgi:hypothetical protein